MDFRDVSEALEALEEHEMDMTQKDHDFYRSLRDKASQPGTILTLTPAQESWLSDLVERYHE